MVKGLNAFQRWLFAPLLVRFEQLEKGAQQLQVIKITADAVFAMARWEITSPNAQFDQQARREQAGMLLAWIQVYELMGYTAPADIAQMVALLSQRQEMSERVTQLVHDTQAVIAQ